jgi:hypothetical protein
VSEIKPRRQAKDSARRERLLSIREKRLNFNPMMERGKRQKS